MECASTMALRFDAPSIRLLVAPATTLAFASAPAYPLLRGMFDDMALRHEMVVSPAELVDRAMRLQPASVFVDADAPACAVDVLRAVRSVAPDALLVALDGYWSEREMALRGIADVLLYKPPRADAWAQALRTLGIGANPPAATPSPLLRLPVR